MRAVTFIGGLLLLLLLVRDDAAAPVAADPELSGYPNSMAVLGDSISQGNDADPTIFGDQPENAWATGTNPSVNSVYSRLLAVHPPIAGNRMNSSVSGAKMVDLQQQAQTTINLGGAEAVLVLMGANDVCTPSEASMTSVATFQAQFEYAMATLSNGLPDARISVGSIPDVYNLWSILKDNPNAQFIWSFASICQSLLANPASTAPADVLRRANVRQRNIDFNTVLANVCATYIHCRFDDNAGFNTAFEPQHVSTLDYFHPSIAGQALAASVAWSSVYDFSDAAAPVSTSAGVTSGGSSQVTLSATDASGVSGIEYKLGGGWLRYGAPITLPAGSAVTWRAVDLNGNTEATKTCVAQLWSWSTGDSDCDAFPDTVTTVQRGDEAFIGTDPLEHCNTTSAFNDEPDAWPPDFNDSRRVDLSDLGLFGAVYNTAPPNPLYNQRFDLNADSRVNLADLGVFGAFYNKTCA